MIYIKSFIAGIAAIGVAIVVTILAAGAYIYFLSKPAQHGAIGWDPTAVSKPLAWMVGAAIFAAGFVWEFRHVAK